MRRSKWRRRVKWALTIVSALCTLVFVGSFHAFWVWGAGETCYEFFGGVFHYQRDISRELFPFWDLRLSRGWYVSPEILAIVYPPRFEIDIADAYIPLWIPLIPLLTDTLFLWRRDRRPRAGHCSCGYNLTGNVSGICPECGRPIAFPRT